MQHLLGTKYMPAPSWTFIHIIFYPHVTLRGEWVFISQMGPPVL